MREAGARRSAIVVVKRAMLASGPSSASAAAGVSAPETSRTAVAVAASVGSRSPTISSARAPARRAAISFSIRDVRRPPRWGGIPSSTSTTRSRASIPAQSS
jgi:hypothetical protein